MRAYRTNLYTPEQREWCRNYQRATTFEPVMDGYEAGEKSFVDAAKWNLEWFEGWMVDAFHAAEGNGIPGDSD